MRNRFLTAALLLLTAPATALAQADAWSDLTPPDLNAAPGAGGTCAAQFAANPMPPWTEEIPVRQNWKTALLIQIYRETSAEAVLENGHCSCELWFPAWDAADAIYQDRYAALPYEDQLQATREHRRQYMSMAQDLRVLCRAVGG